MEQIKSIALFIQKDKKKPTSPDVTGKIQFANKTARGKIQDEENYPVALWFDLDGNLNGVINDKEKNDKGHYPQIGTLKLESKPKNDKNRPVLVGIADFQDGDKYSLSLWPHKSEKTGRAYFFGNVQDPNERREIERPDEKAIANYNNSLEELLDDLPF